MADAAYDAVIVGGGTKGIVTALYLAKYGGMSVGIFEERPELCSGLSSEQAVVPGFVGDHHATSMGHWYFVPLKEDFPNFERNGGQVVQCEATFGGIAVEDQSCWVIYNNDVDPNRERTAKSLAQFSSERDAETYLKLWEITKPGTDFYIAMLQGLYDPPSPPGAPPSPLERWFENYMNQPDSLMDYSWRTMPAINAVPRLWERPAVAYFYLRQLSVGGRLVHLLPGFDVLTRIPLTPELGFLKGGTHSLAHAYQRLLYEVGGQWFPWNKVEKIIIENGTAKGVQLADGTRVEAKKLVVSSVDPFQLLLNLVGKDHISAQVLRKVELLIDNMIGLAWYGWFMHDLPEYQAAAFNPDINYCGNVVLGSDDVRHLSNTEHWLGLGKVPPVQGHLYVFPQSVCDKTRVPEGKHVVMEDCKLPTVSYLSEREWLRLKKTHAQQAIEEWQKYAPNMTWDNIIGYDPQTPYDVAHRGLNFARSGNPGIVDRYPGQHGRTAPIAELAQFRTPIKNLYATGGWHPPTGANCCGGYACYKNIAEDFGLGKPWKDKGRPF
jgi:beta-carotene ketolase (CrtO type)